MKKLLLALLLLPSIAYSAPQAVGPFNFGEGLNLNSYVTEIKDNQSPDMCDCVSNSDGSLEERYGNKLFVDNALSSQPVTSLYRARASTGTTARTVTIGVNGNRIVYSSSDINPQWVTLSSGIQPGQNWSFATMNNEVIMTGDGLTDDIKSFNIITSSFMNFYDRFNVTGNSEAVKVRCKYLLQKSNYLLFINAAEVTNGTTFYPSRTYYSILNISSPATTYNRFFEVRTNDGEQLTGGGVMLDRVNLFKPSSIHELSFNILNLGSQGGDQSLAEVVSGFGLKAPRVNQNIGLFYVIGSQDSIRFWDGGRRSRLNVSEESRSISTLIKPLIDNLIKNKTYENMVCEYYKKREWLVFSYENPNKFPRGVNNSVLVYDIRLDQWFPLCGMTAASFESFDLEGDDGKMIYGDSNDGLTYRFDQESAVDDAPHQVSLDTMDSSQTWIGNNFSSNYNAPAEGTGSIKMWVGNGVTVSSIAILKNFNMGEFYDKVKVLKSTGEGFDGDKIQFKINSSSWPNITSVRIDLLVNDVANQFDNNFTSVTLITNNILSFSSYTVGNTTWTTVQVALSSFPIRDDWASFVSETVPFAKSLFFYGIRFTVTGVNISSVSFDDVRLIQEKNPVNFYRFTKLYDFNSISNKTLGEVSVAMEKPVDSVLHIDIYNDFGKKVKTETFEAELPKEIIVFGLTSTASIAILDDLTWKIKRSTELDPSQYYPFNGVADKDYIFFSDRTNNRLVKMRRSDFVIVSTYGSFGSGTANQNTAHQMDLDGKGNLYFIDLNNQRVKIHSSDNLQFLKMAGSLGDMTTSYHQPTGIAVNETEALVADEGNYRWKKISVSTLGFISSKIVEYNTIGDTSIEQDENYYYGAYNKTSDLTIFYQDVALESRFKGNLDLVNRTNIYPDNVVVLSTIALQGDIGIRGRYIFVPFASNVLAISPDYYIQKRLLSDFSLVSQFKTSKRIFSTLGDPLSHIPYKIDRRKKLGSQGRYIQLKYYDSGSDNRVKLINQTFIIEDTPITYRGGD